MGTTEEPARRRATRPVGIGVVGLGMAAGPHAHSLQDLGDRAAVRGVFGRDRVRREAFAARYGFPAAESLDALLADPAVDAVLLLTPPDTRTGLVEAIAGAGKHILMEKPVERTTAAAEAIVATCERHGVALGIILQHRFRAGSLRLRALLAEGSLGPIGSVRLAVPWWRPQGYYDEPGRGTLARDGGGALITQAIHPMDLMLSLTGPVDEVQAIAGATRLHRMETEDFVGAGLRFANGALGSLVATTAAFPGAAEQLCLDCENGSARLEAGELTIHWRDGRVEHQGEPAGGGGADPMAFPHDWHRALIAEFLDAIEAGRPPAVTGREALNVHRLIDALLASARERCAVKVS